MTYPHYRCWYPGRLEAVLRPIVATAFGEASFLATHLPIVGFGVAKDATNSKELVAQPRDEVLLRTLAGSTGRVCAFVKGSHGSGKSHLIRWMLYRWRTFRPDDHVIFIERRDATLRGTLKRLVDSLGDQRHLADALEKAANVLSERGVKANVLLKTILLLDPDNRQSSMENGDLAKKLHLSALFDDVLVKELLRRPGGLVDQVVSKMVGSATADKQVEDIPEFNAELLRNLAALSNPTLAVRNAFNRILSDMDTQRRVLAILNDSLRIAMREAAGVQPDALSNLLDGLRRELHGRGKRLVLLVEDISCFPGIDAQLVEALFDDGAERSDLAPMLSVVGITENYFQSHFAGKGAALNRITHLIDLSRAEGAQSESYALSSDDAIAAFAGRYLNAARFPDEEAFEEWLALANTSVAVDPPSACRGCDFRDRCHAAFGTDPGGDYGLYPFNRPMLVKSFRALLDQDTASVVRTPRTFKSYLGVLLSADDSGQAQNDFLFTEMERLLHRDYLPPVDPDVDEVARTRFAGNPGLIKSSVALTRFWGDGTLASRGVRSEVFGHFGLPAPSESEQDTPDPEPEPCPEPHPEPRPPEGGGSRKEPIPPPPPPPPPPVEPENIELVGRAEDLKRWYDHDAPLERESEWQKVVGRLVDVGLSRRALGVPTRMVRDKVLPESVFFIQGQKGQKRPFPLEIGRNQTTYRALQAAAHLQYGTEKDAFARRRRLLEFGVAMAPEAEEYVRKAITLVEGEPWEPGLTAVQLLIAEAVMAGRVRLSEGLPRILDIAFSESSNDSRVPAPGWQAAITALQVQRKPLIETARLWLAIRRDSSEMRYLTTHSVMRRVTSFLEGFDLDQVPGTPLPKSLTDLERMRSLACKFSEFLLPEALSAAETLLAELVRDYQQPALTTMPPSEFVKRVAAICQQPAAIKMTSFTKARQAWMEAENSAVANRVDAASWTSERHAAELAGMRSAQAATGASRKCDALANLDLVKLQSGAKLLKAGSNLLVLVSEHFAADRRGLQLAADRDRELARVRKAGREIKDALSQAHAAVSRISTPDLQAEEAAE